MVSDVFDEMSFGRVKNVDFIHKMGSDGKAYNAAYIHFYEWYDNTVARNFQERVLDPKREARVMYDDPWYWIVLENKGKKHVPGQRKPRIDLDAFNTPERPVAPSLSQREPGAPVKIKSWAQAVQPPAPLNLQKEFDIEAQYASEEITQEEMDWAWEQMEIQRERENECLISVDGRYVQSLEQENEMLRSQVAYFQNLYYTETIKTQTLMDTIASTGYKA